MISLTFRNPAYKQDCIQDIQDTIDDALRIAEYVTPDYPASHTDDENLNTMLHLDAGIRAGLVEMNMEVLADFIPKQDMMLSECSYLESSHTLEYNYFQCIFCSANGRLYHSQHAFREAVEYFGKAEKYGDAMLNDADRYQGADKSELLGFLQWANQEVLENAFLATYGGGNSKEAYRLLQKWAKLLAQSENNLDSYHQGRIADLYEAASDYAVDVADPYSAAKWIEIASLTLSIQNFGELKGIDGAKELLFRVEKLLINFQQNGTLDHRDAINLIKEAESFIQRESGNTMATAIASAAEGMLYLATVQIFISAQQMKDAETYADEAIRYINRARETLENWLADSNGTYAELFFFRRLYLRMEQRQLASFEFKGDINQSLGKPEAAVAAYEKCLSLLKRNTNPICNISNERIATIYYCKLGISYLASGNGKDGEYYAGKCLDGTDKLLANGYDETLHACRLQTCLTAASVYINARMKKEAKQCCEIGLESLSALKQNGSRNPILQYEPQLLQIYRKSKSWF